MLINPYLNFKGQCEEAFTFYEQVLGGKITDKHLIAGSPAESELPPEMKDKVMHMRLVIGDMVLMGSDSPPEYFEQPQGLWVSINVDTPEEAERIYQALSAGGSIRMPLGETFWARRFAMFIDRFGTPWMINCGHEQA